MGFSALAGLLLAAAPPLPSVVAVDGVLCDLTRSLVQGSARVTCLVPPGADPHAMALRGSDRQALSSAQLVLVNGYNLTPAMQRIRVSAPVVPVAERAVPRNKALDPHVWHDPALTSAMVQATAAALKPVLGSAQGAALQRRSQAMQAVLNQLGSWSAQQLQTVPTAQRVWHPRAPRARHLRHRRNPAALEPCCHQRSHPQVGHQGHLCRGVATVQNVAAD